LALHGCVGTEETRPDSGKSTAAGAATESQPVDSAPSYPQFETFLASPEYANASIRGPQLVVLPGEVKSTNAGFRAKIAPNAIADYAEHELHAANFGVLERSGLNQPAIRRMQIAANMGDVQTLAAMKPHYAATADFFVQLDILRAEPVAQAEEGFEGPRTSTIMDLLSKTPASSFLRLDAATVESKEASKVWLVGLRYRVIDLATGEQVHTNYFEEKLELGSKSVGVLVARKVQTSTVTMDDIVQLLVQRAVADLDAKGKVSEPPVPEPPTEASELGLPSEAEPGTDASDSE